MLLDRPLTRKPEEMTSKHRYGDAGRVLLEYGDDVRGAVMVYADGGLFSEARRTVRIDTYSIEDFTLTWESQITRHAPSSDLLEEIVYPSALERKQTIGEEAAEVLNLLNKQISRIRELRAKRSEDEGELFIMFYIATTQTDIQMRTGASRTFLSLRMWMS